MCGYLRTIFVNRCQQKNGQNFAKIVEKRSDTIRKYEKKGLIPSGKKFTESCKSYKNWRYYDREDVYNMVLFFNDRTPGRPVNKRNISAQVKVIKISEKIKLGRK